MLEHELLAAISLLYALCVALLGYGFLYDTYTQKVLPVALLC